MVTVSNVASGSFENNSQFKQIYDWMYKALETSITPDPEQRTGVTRVGQSCSVMSVIVDFLQPTPRYVYNRCIGAKPAILFDLDLLPIAMVSRDLGSEPAPQRTICGRYNQYNKHRKYGSDETFCRRRLQWFSLERDCLYSWWLVAAAGPLASASRHD